MPFYLGSSEADGHEQRQQSTWIRIPNSRKTGLNPGDFRAERLQDGDGDSGTQVEL